MYIKIFSGHWFVDCFLKMASSNAHGLLQFKKMLTTIYRDNTLRAWYHLHHSSFFHPEDANSTSPRPRFAEDSPESRRTLAYAMTIKNALADQSFNVPTKKMDWAGFCNASRAVTNWRHILPPIRGTQAIVEFDFNLYGRTQYLDLQDTQISQDYWSSIKYGHHLQQRPMLWSINEPWNSHTSFEIDE
jgi:hypothetical protein